MTDDRPLFRADTDEILAHAMLVQKFAINLLVSGGELTQDEPMFGLCVSGLFFAEGLGLVDLGRQEVTSLMVANIAGLGLIMGRIEAAAKAHECWVAVRAAADRECAHQLGTWDTATLGGTVPPPPDTDLPPLDDLGSTNG